MMKTSHQSWFQRGLKAAHFRIHHFAMNLDAGNGNSAEHSGLRDWQQTSDIIDIPA
jgi:hypothetical protein